MTNSYPITGPPMEPPHDDAPYFVQVEQGRPGYCSTIRLMGPCGVVANQSLGDHDSTTFNFWCGRLNDGHRYARTLVSHNTLADRIYVALKEYRCLGYRCKDDNSASLLDVLSWADGGKTVENADTELSELAFAIATALRPQTAETGKDTVK